MSHRGLGLALVFGLVACTRPAEDRAARDLTIGTAAIDAVTVDVAGGLGHIRALAPGALALWAQAPVLELVIEVDPDAAGDWTITAGNVLADAELTAIAAGTPLAVVALGGARPTERAWRVPLPTGATTVRIAPPDAGALAAWRFAVMGDIQNAMPTVHEVFARINLEPGVRFVISLGDIVHRGRDDEWDLFAHQLTTLDVPFYSTIGNHELWGNLDRWYRSYGRANIHFRFRGVAVTLVDSASATLDPSVHGWLDGWLAESAGDLHLFGTHYPLVDPIGLRQGSFASHREAQALLARLAAGGVDLTVYGHIHTYEGFSNAGIPAHISGGGGADPMRFDGIDRHFLVVDADPAAAAFSAVTVVRVD